MQIQAFKDPVSGRIFENEKDLCDFQEEQAALAKKEARIAEIKDRLKYLRLNVTASLSTPAELDVLIAATYREVLALLDELATLQGVRRTKAELKKKVELLSATTKNARIKWSDYHSSHRKDEIILEFDVEIVFSRDAYYRLFCDEIQDLKIDTVVTGSYVYCGGSNTNHSDETYEMSYNVRIPLRHLPRLQPRIKELARMTSEKSAHENKVSSAQYEAQRNSPERAGAIAKLQEAQEQVDAALRLRREAEDAVSTIEASISAQVERDMPFPQAGALRSAQAGFDGLIRGDWEYLINALP